MSTSHLWAGKELHQRAPGQEKILAVFASCSLWSMAGWALPGNQLSEAALSLELDCSLTGQILDVPELWDLGHSSSFCSDLLKSGTDTNISVCNQVLHLSQNPENMVDSFKIFALNAEQRSQKIRCTLHISEPHQPRFWSLNNLFLFKPSFCHCFPNHSTIFEPVYQKQQKG